MMIQTKYNKLQGRSYDFLKGARSHSFKSWVRTSFKSTSTLFFSESDNFADEP